MAAHVFISYWYSLSMKPIAKTKTGAKVQAGDSIEVDK